MTCSREHGDNDTETVVSQSVRPEQLQYVTPRSAAGRVIRAVTLSEHMKLVRHPRRRQRPREGYRKDGDGQMDGLVSATAAQRTRLVR
jgi:hypothetical protein